MKGPQLPKRNVHESQLNVVNESKNSAVVPTKIVLLLALVSTLPLKLGIGQVPSQNVVLMKGPQLPKRNIHESQLNVADESKNSMGAPTKIALLLALVSTLPL